MQGVDGGYGGYLSPKFHYSPKFTLIMILYSDNPINIFHLKTFAATWGTLSKVGIFPTEITFSI